MYKFLKNINLKADKMYFNTFIIKNLPRKISFQKEPRFIKSAHSSLPISKHNMDFRRMENIMQTLPWL